MVDPNPPFATPKTSGESLYDVWEQLVPHLAGRPIARLSPDRGKNYKPAHERSLGTLPNKPAAVMLYSRFGVAKVLAVDLDGHGDEKKVQADAQEITGKLAEHGLRWIEDVSPIGNRHIYVPVEGGVSLPQAVKTLEALSRIYSTVDPAPHRHKVHGCIRMPASPYKTGGHQMLIGSLEDALSIALNPAANKNFVAFCHAVQRWAPAAAAPVQLDTSSDSGEEIDARHAGTTMSKSMLQIAIHGVHDYPSASEARFAVLRAAVNAGYSGTDIYQKIVTGGWSGLGYLCKKYTNLMRGLSAELTRLKNKPISQGKSSVQKNNTSRPKAQGGIPSVVKSSFRDFHKTWLNAMFLKESSLPPNRESLGLKLVLRALAEAAAKTRDSVVEFGTRSLAIACGLDYSTVARHLVTLRTDDDPLIRLVRSAQGKDADAYELVIPEALDGAARRRSYRRGKIHSLRPVFRVLGPSAAFCYEAVESGATTVKEIIELSGLGRSCVYESLALLQTLGLVIDFAGYRTTGMNLSTLAEQLGADELVAKQKSEYAVHRRIWINWLSRRFQEQLLPQIEEDYPFELFEPPPQEWERYFNIPIDRSMQDNTLYTF